MGLLTQPRHRVTAVCRARKDGDYGEPVYEPNGVKKIIRCNVHPLTSTEQLEWGVIDGVTRKIIAPSWPVDSHALIELDCKLWEQVGQPEHLNTSKRTNHWRVIIRRIGG